MRLSIPIALAAALACQADRAPKTPAPTPAPALPRALAPSPAGDAPASSAGPTPQAATPAHAAGHAPPSAARAAERAAAMLGTILRDNAHFAREHGVGYFQRFRDDQHPRATVVACADSRFHTDAIDRMPDDDLFVVRNIGNQIDSTPGSVEYAIRHLHTPLLLVIGHVRCGAVKAAMSDYGNESAPIRRELDGLHLSIFRTRAQGSFAEKWLANVVGNVHEQIRDAMNEYKEDVRSGRLFAVGAVYDFRNDLGQGPGKLVLVNVNGETDPKRIAALPLLRTARRAYQK